jgi:hypothetical protein
MCTTHNYGNTNTVLTDNKKLPTKSAGVTQKVISDAALEKENLKKLA